MNLNKRNKNNVISRWKKVHKEEEKYIKKNKSKTKHLRARLCGFLAGDGNILVAGKGKNKHNTVRFFPDHSSLIKSFEEAILKTYNRSIKIKEKKNHYFITVDSKPIVKDILSLAKFGTYDWNIPEKLATLEKIEWLRAFFDCEGYVHKKYIRVQSVNEKGLNEVKDLLESIRINSKMYSHIPKNKKHSEVFILNIGRKEDREKYLELVGFNHTIKFKKLQNQLEKNAVIA